MQGSLAHLFQWQLPEQRQRAGEQPDEEGRGRAHYVDHGGWQHRDVGVLPAEGVDECYHGMAAFGQSAAGGQTERSWLSVGEGRASTAEAREEDWDHPRGALVRINGSQMITANTSTKKKSVQLQQP